MLYELEYRCMMKKGQLGVTQTNIAASMMLGSNEMVPLLHQVAFYKHMLQATGIQHISFLISKIFQFLIFWPTLKCALLSLFKTHPFFLVM